MKKGSTHASMIMKSGLLVFILMPWLFLFLYQVTQVSPCCVKKLINNPISMGVISVFNGAIFSYIYLMMTDVFEDYISNKQARKTMELIVFVVFVFLWSICQFSILKVGI